VVAIAKLHEIVGQAGSGEASANKLPPERSSTPFSRFRWLVAEPKFFAKIVQY
jgi:hypothetical protein